MSCHSYCRYDYLYRYVICRINIIESDFSHFLWCLDPFLSLIMMKLIFKMCSPFSSLYSSKSSSAFLVHLAPFFSQKQWLVFNWFLKKKYSPQFGYSRTLSAHFLSLSVASTPLNFPGVNRFPLQWPISHLCLIREYSTEIIKNYVYKSYAMLKSF